MCWADIECSTHLSLYIIEFEHHHGHDTVAEWSKAPGSGPGSKERGFKSHRCQLLSVMRAKS